MTREELIDGLKTMSAAATMMMGKSARDAIVAEVQSLSERIAVLEGENSELGKQRLMILAAVYKEAPRFVATICDKNLDRSGALLGQVRELSRASLIKEGSHATE